MLGLYGSLELGQRSLTTQRKGVELTAHNLANVNNPDYARQRLEMQSVTLSSSQQGTIGFGVEPGAVRQMRDDLLDAQIQGEKSVTGFLATKVDALELLQSSAGQTINRHDLGPENGGHVRDAGSTAGLADGLTDLFSSFHGLANEVTSSTERRVVLDKAQTMVQQFNQFEQRMDRLETQINQQVETDVNAANDLLGDIAGLNEAIARGESGTGNKANELRDSRNKKLEELAALVGFQSSGTGSSVNISINGETVVAGDQKVGGLAMTTDANGKPAVALEGSNDPATSLSGSIGGLLSVRDSELTSFRDDIDLLAGRLIEEVNALHSQGFALDGTTGRAFFEGTGAGSIRINQALLDDPSLIQASSVAGEVGNNEIILQLAELGTQRFADLGNQTFGERYGETIADLGQGLASARSQLEDQEAVEGLLGRQRDAVSGVSLDEEMTSLMRYQRAFEASAKLIRVIDELMNTTLNLKP